MPNRRLRIRHASASASILRDVVRGAAFARSLGVAELDRIERDMQARQVDAGGHLAWKGDAVEHWIVVIDGMVKVEATAADGRRTTLIGVTGAGWLGESALLGDGRWPFDVIATQPTTVGLMPRATFEWLLDTSLAFNRCLLDQLNARLRQFASRCEHVRFCEANRHVAHCLAELYDPRLCPGTERRLGLSQDDVAHLAGISRPTAHRALHELELQGVLSVAYGAITVHDPEALQRLGSLH